MVMFRKEFEIGVLLGFITILMIGAALLYAILIYGGCI